MTNNINLEGCFGIQYQDPVLCETRCKDYKRCSLHLIQVRYNRDLDLQTNNNSYSEFIRNFEKISRGDRR